MSPRESCSNCHVRVILRASLADDGAGRQIVLEIDLDGLVVDVELPFQVVEFRLLENFPPVAAQHLVLGRSDFPSLRVLEVDWRFLVVGGSGRGRGRLVVRRPRDAPRQDDG